MQTTSDNVILLLAVGLVSMLLLAFTIILLHIKSQNRVLREKELAHQKELEHQKLLLNAIITSQESERKRIGQDLHDDIGAALSGLRLTMDIYEPSAQDREPYTQFNKHCKEAIDHIITEVRHISHSLSPTLLSLHGLGAAIHKQLEFVNRSGGITATVQNNAVNQLNQLELSVATAIYRVLEELLNNTIKHANATVINLNFEECEGVLQIQYNDNGVGLPAHHQTQAKGMGLQNIESRLSMIQANYQISSNQDIGFRMDIHYNLLPQTIEHA